MAGRRPISSRTLYVTGFPPRITASELAIDFERYVRTSHAESGHSYAAISRRPRRLGRDRTRLWNTAISATPRTRTTICMGFASAPIALISSMPKYVRARLLTQEQTFASLAHRWSTAGAPIALAAAS